MMLTDVLSKIGRQTTFAARHTLPAAALRIRIAGVGQLDLPISAAKAKALCRIAKPARYGYKDRTLLDTSVRDTWEIAAPEIDFDESAWERALSPALSELGRKLGLGPDRQLRAELHNLLVYAPGQFFLPHQDSEKSDDMLGTLVGRAAVQIQRGRHHRPTPRRPGRVPRLATGHRPHRVLFLAREFSLLVRVPDHLSAFDHRLVDGGSYRAPKRRYAPG